VQTTYLYTPLVASGFLNNVPMTDQIYMIPRASAAIPYTG
jgi:hypothetical protein